MVDAIVTVESGVQKLIPTYRVETGQRVSFVALDLTGDLVLGDDCLAYYALNPGAANRTITIPATTILYKQILIYNSGSNKNITVTDGGLTSVLIRKQEQYSLNFDGTDWHTRRQ